MKNKGKKFIACLMLITVLVSISGFASTGNIEKAVDVKTVSERLAPGSMPAKTDSAITEEQTGEVQADNSLSGLISQGGPLMIFLILLGIFSLTIIIERLIFFSRTGAWSTKKLELLIKEKAWNTGHHYREEMEDALRGCAALCFREMEKGLGLLSGIGNLSPIVGFLGTVVGMISAFASIASSSSVNAKIVASGIQTALVTTAGGLFVAAPSILFFYIFSHIISDRLSFSEKLIDSLCSDLPGLSSCGSASQEKAIS